MIDAPGHPGVWPGLIVEWQRREDGWHGRVAYVLGEAQDEDVRLVERWLPAACLRTEPPE